MTERSTRPLCADAKRIVGDYLEHKGRDGGLRECFLETALYVEETLKITLSDSDISPERLGDEQEILRLVEQKMDGGT